MAKSEQPSVILESSLQAYFYTQLQEFNEKFVAPLPNETIYYSSMVMDKFGESVNFFERCSEGRIREKVLGLKLLKTNNLSKEEKRRALKDIGDTALVVCGFFSDSLNKKLVDVRYYQEIGQNAYQQLNNVIPEAYDIPRFFDILSRNFDRLTSVMNLVSEKTLNQSWDSESVYLIVSKKLAS